MQFSWFDGVGHQFRFPVILYDKYDKSKSKYLSY